MKVIFKLIIDAKNENKSGGQCEENVLNLIMCTFCLI